jgi:hypothetical protein
MSNYVVVGSKADSLTNGMGEGHEVSRYLVNVGPDVFARWAQTECRCGANAKALWHVMTENYLELVGEAWAQSHTLALAETRA